MPHIEIIARAVIRHGNHILLCRAVEGGYEYLPGGHVEFGERAAAAVARELEEEAGLAVRVGGLLLVSENRFEARGKTHHELNLVFHVEQSTPLPPPPATGSSGGWASGPVAPASREPEIEFEWVDLAAIVERDLRPATIKAWLLAQGAGPAAGGAEWVSGLEM